MSATGSTSQWYEPNGAVVAPVAGVRYLSEVGGIMEVSDDVADATHMWARHADGYLVVVPYVAGESLLISLGGYVLPIKVPDA